MLTLYKGHAQLNIILCEALPALGTALCNRQHIN